MNEFPDGVRSDTEKSEHLNIVNFLASVYEPELTLCSSPCEKRLRERSSVLATLLLASICNESVTQLEPSPLPQLVLVNETLWLPRAI